ncbi:MAG: NAD(P)H-dependent oxidoreductase subunit E [Candidatus Firestonebacteria bacterium]
MSIDEILEKYNKDKSFLIPILQDVSAKYNYLPADILKEISVKLDIPLSQIFSVATFYKAFSLKPRGKHHICVCIGTACHVRGSQKILDKFEDELNIKSGETTDDLNVTLETVNCLGACALAPLVTTDDQYFAKMTTSKADKIIKEYKKSDEKN